MDDLIVSALLAKTYKTKPVHVQLCEKLKERKEEVQIGDRIPYVYIENTTNNRLQKSELGEDPLYAKEHGLKFNRKCYIEQLSKPLLGFFKCILDKAQLSELEDYTSLYLKRLKN
jgi:DNA polymerase elongation subunit (family B)